MPKFGPHQGAPAAYSTGFGGMAAGMQQQPPHNIYFVNSSFERGQQGVPGQPPCRYPCCVTPGSALSMAPAAAGAKQQMHQKHARSPYARQGAGAQGRSSSESKKLARVGGPLGKHQRPETFYINTITNNYYQVKKRNAQLARQAEANKIKNEQVSNQPALTQGNGEDRMVGGRSSGYRAGSGTGAESAARAPSGATASGNGANPAATPPFQQAASFGFAAYHGFNPHHGHQGPQHPSAHHHPGMHPQHHQMPPHFGGHGHGHGGHGNHGQSPYMNVPPPMCTCMHGGARPPTPLGMPAPYGYPGAAAPNGYGPESPYHHGASPMAAYGPGYAAAMGHQYPGAAGPMQQMPMYGGLLPHDFSHHHGDGPHDGEQDELEDS